MIGLVPFLYIPSPTSDPIPSLHLGPLTIRAYALCILAGIFVSVWMSNRRYQDRGGPRGAIIDIAFWAVPFGIVGARIYHVLTDPELYFAPGKDPLRAFYIWDGGLGIWGGIAAGALGAFIGCRRMGLKFPPVADAIAPTLLIAQAIGRLGNWFNQELFGGPTTLPWGLKVSDSVTLSAGYPVGTLFHPTFLYEALWNLAMAAILIWADRRFKLGHGRVMSLYVVAYTAGRLWIELIRVDYANEILGLRVNVWTSILVGLGGLIVFLILSKTKPGREASVYLPGHEPGDLAALVDTVEANEPSDDDDPAEQDPDGSTSSDDEPDGTDNDAPLPSTMKDDPLPDAD